MKRINILKFWVVAMGCSAAFIACKKDEVNIPPDKAKKMQFDWKITGISVPKTGQPGVDSPLLKACMADDIVKFNAAQFDFQDGANKCDSTIFYYIKGNWSFDAVKDSVRLNATNPAKYVSWKVVTLNDSILKVNFIDSTNPAKKLTKTISFKH